MKIKGPELFLNLVFWLGTSWIILSSFSIQFQEIELVDGVETVHIIRSNNIIFQLLICIGIGIALFYSNLWNILQLNNSQAKTIIFRSSMLLLTSILLFFLILYSLSPYFSEPLPLNLSWGTLIFYFTISVAYGLGRVWIITDNLRKKLALEKKEAELTLLRNQLQPHFLFNVLNNILSMVDQQKNPLVAESLDRLSALLRYVVYDTSFSKVPVRKEIEFIKNFAELQMLRFEKGEVIFDLKVEGNHQHHKIEPGIFIPFVENAFKYGTEPEKQSTIKIRFDLRKEDLITFKICNPIFAVMQSKNQTGTGIHSTRERLKLVYPGKHQLSISQQDNFEVELKIETNASNHH